MSLYNQLFKENEDANVLLGVLNLNKGIFERYRDVYLNKEGTEITVYTRCGGKNRIEYERVFEIMKRHPNYISNWDDKGDNTYAYIKFSVPEKYKELCKKIAPKKDPLSISEKFEKECKELEDSNSDSFKRAKEILGPVFDFIEKDLKDNPPNNDDGPEIRFIKL